MQINVLTLSVIKVKKCEKVAWGYAKLLETFQGLEKAANDKKLWFIRRQAY